MNKNGDRYRKDNTKDGAVGNRKYWVKDEKIK